MWVEAQKRKFMLRGKGRRSVVISFQVEVHSRAKGPQSGNSVTQSVGSSFEAEAHVEGEGPAKLKQLPSGSSC